MIKKHTKELHFGVFIMLSVLFVHLLFLKILTIPITHDESGQILYYAQLPVLEILNFNNPWPTNHILNSLLIKLSTKILGFSNFSGRLPVFLSAMVYIFIIYKLSKLAFKNNIYALILTFAIFLLNPYLFEFFALARGYGMGASLLLLAIYFLVKHTNEHCLGSLFFLMLTSFLMVMANFSYLVVYCALILLSIYSSGLNKNYKALLIIFLGVLVTSLFSVLPIIRMSETNQFTYWEQGGFFKQTFDSLWVMFKYDSSFNFLPRNLALFLILAVVFIEFVLSIKEKNNAINLFKMASWLLLLTFVVNVTQHYLVKTPYLNNRTAILYIVLFSFVLLSLSYRLYCFRHKLFYFTTTPLLFFLVIHFFKVNNSKFVYEWRYDQNTTEVLAILVKEHKLNDSKIALNTCWLFHPSFNFYDVGNNLDWLELEPYHKEAQLEKKEMYYYTVKEELALALENNYFIIANFEDERYLLKQR